MTKLTILGFALAAMLLLARTGETQTTSPQPTSPSANNIPAPHWSQPHRRKIQRQEQERRQFQEQQRYERHRQDEPLPPAQQNPPQPQRLKRQEEQEQGPSKQQLLQEQTSEHRRKFRSAHPSKPVPPQVMSYSAALQRCQHDPHPRGWWAQHYAVIVLSGGGYYYFDSGYWFPAFGYDPNYEAYDYDGPIYTYGNLLPDQVILNVQRALTDLGYYSGALSGSLSPATRYAISAYQQDNGLPVNGIVDAPLVYSLGLA
jgi:hypothetical protein